MARAGLARAAVTSILLSSIFSLWFTFNNFQQPAYAIDSQKTWAKTYDGAVLRLNSSGGVELVKSFNSGSSDFKAYATSIREASDGGYIVAGIMIQQSTPSVDAWLLKLDSDGNVEWQKSYASYLS